MGLESILTTPLPFSSCTVPLVDFKNPSSSNSIYFLSPLTESYISKLVKSGESVNTPPLTLNTGDNV